MPEETTEQLTKLAKELFNQTWDLLDRTDRTPADDLTMVGYALASWALWRRVGAPKNHAISDWQVARVFALLGDAGWSARYAAAGLATCRDRDLGPFLLGYAWESVARAASLAGDAEQVSEAIAASRAAADLVDDPDDRQLILDDLDELTA